MYIRRLCRTRIGWPLLETHWVAEHVRSKMAKRFHCSSVQKAPGSLPVSFLLSSRISTRSSVVTEQNEVGFNRISFCSVKATTAAAATAELDFPIQYRVPGETVKSSVSRKLDPGEKCLNTPSRVYLAYLQVCLFSVSRVKRRLWVTFYVQVYKISCG